MKIKLVYFTNEEGTMAKYIEKQKDGSEVTRWDKDKSLTQEEKKVKWREAEKEVKDRKVICLTDLV